MTEQEKPKKGIYIGAPACFKLDIACSQIMQAFGGDTNKPIGIYVVGSCMERPDWRDVDVRMIMDDESFKELFPDALIQNAAWEHDPRWRLLTVTISDWLKNQTGLPVDFQFQPMSWANSRHKKPRSAIGFTYVKRKKFEEDDSKVLPPISDRKTLDLDKTGFSLLNNDGD